MRLIFFTLVTLMVSTLTFSMSSISVAQQNLVQTEVTKAAAEQDAKVVNFEAKIAAEQDASKDINRFLWFGAGIGACCIAAPIGGFAGCLVGELIAPTNSSGLLYFEIGTGATVGFFVGAAVGTLAPLIGISSYKGHPPPERLIGKSPEYVEFYTNAYRAKARSLRTQSAAAGAAIGLGAMLINYLVNNQ